MLITEENIKKNFYKDSSNVLTDISLDRTTFEQFRRPVERPFIKSERENTTLLFGGLTWKHERLLEGFFEGLGYKCQPLPNSDLESLQIGKEYCDPGCCNPTYFTCGSLIMFLKRQEENGLTKSEINEKFVYFTAGSCGPCRFGMYEAQYRMALKNAGFEGFRVIVFQQSEGFDQTRNNAGLEMNPDFFIGILICFILGDLVNDLAYSLRPYEVNKGEVDKVLEECIEIGYNQLKNTKKINLLAFIKYSLKKNTNLLKLMELILKIFHQFFSKDYKFIVQCYKEKFSKIEVDYLRVKPIVKIIGEFWAQTTEGDGNFNMHKFIESEGAQVIPEALGNWILYISHQTRLRIDDQAKAIKMKYGFFKKFKTLSGYYLSYYLLVIGEKVYRAKYNHFRRILNEKPILYAPQDLLRKYAETYFNPRIEGGEGHLEIGKTVFYTRKKYCHMFVSLKPFGCMPSQQSDGVMSAVTSKYPDILFLPIETSGEGLVNAQSRVQMTLNEANEQAKKEFKLLLERKGLDLNKIKNYVSSNSDKFSDPFYKIKNRKYISVAANFINNISKKISL